MPPVKHDGSTNNLIYQVHDGATKSIIPYDGLNALSLDTTFGTGGDSTNVMAWTQSLGKYVTDLSRGVFRLGGAPGKTLTCDVEGENAGASVTFPQTCSDIVKHILLTYSGRASGDLDAASFTQLGTDSTAPLSYYTGTAQLTIAQVMTELLDSVGGYYYLGRDGKVVVGQMRWRTPAATLSYSAGQIASIARVRGPAPVWLVKCGYKRMWTVMRSTDFAGAVTQAVRDERGREWRFAGSADSAHLSLHALAEALTRFSHFDSSSDASAEAARQQAMHELHDRVFNIDARNVQFQIDPGDTITVTHPRYGFGSGRDCFVVGVTENSNGRATQLQVVV